MTPLRQHVQWKNQVSWGQMDLGSNPSSPTDKQLALGKCLGLSEPVFSAVKWDSDSYLTGLLRDLS